MSIQPAQIIRIRLSTADERGKTPALGVVSERLGHTKVAFTLDRYGHVMPGMQEKAAGKLEAILFGR